MMTVANGSYLRFWHDSVAFGVEPVYARVIKVTPKTALVKVELGDIKRIPLDRAERHLISDDDWHPEITTDQTAPNRHKVRG